MKIMVLLLVLLISLGFCAWYKLTPHAIPAASSTLNAGAALKADKAQWVMGTEPDNLIERNYEDPGTGVKWHDSLHSHLPRQLDTTITVYDAAGHPLKFAQYIEPVFNKDAFIFQDRGVWRLQRRSKGAADTLKLDNAVARLARWNALQPDNIKSWKIKLNNIAHTLNLADRVLVLKSKRTLILKRKGQTLMTFHIELGKQPIGQKYFENDGKTPEGIYDLDFKQSRPDVYHKSMLISYPTAAQKQNAKALGKKPGMAILIHGTKPNKINAKDWTNGCIAMQNKDLDTFFIYVDEGTLIEIKP